MREFTTNKKTTIRKTYSFLEEDDALCFFRRGDEAGAFVCCGLEGNFTGVDELLDDGGASDDFSGDSIGSDVDLETTAIKRGCVGETEASNGNVIVIDDLGS